MSSPDALPAPESGMAPHGHDLHRTVARPGAATVRTASLTHGLVKSPLRTS